jgi:hypothetical protein
MMSGVQTVFRGVHDGKVVVERWQDVEEIIEENKRLAADPHQSDCGRLIANIPNVILEKWMNEEGVPVLGLPADEFARFIRRKLNDPDWRHLRTR